MKSQSERKRHRRAQKQPSDLFKFPRRVWDAQISGMRRTALIGFLIGVTLGCLFGVMVGGLPSKLEKGEPDMLSVNQRTGKPQLHIKGKPEIK